MSDSYRIYGNGGKGYKHIITITTYNEQKINSLLDTNYKLIVVKHDELMNMDVPLKVMFGDYNKVKRRIK